MDVDIERVRIQLGRKNIEATLFNSSCPTKGSAIIFPGYFGNNRNGPYGLFVRLARSLAIIGIRTLTFDYLGSGESSPHNRSFFSDLQSSHSIINYFEPCHNFFCIGHSLGCSIVAHICSNFYKSAKGIALAPVTSIKDFSEKFFTETEVLELSTIGNATRRGVFISQSYLEYSEKAWRENYNKLSYIIVAKKDQYARYPKNLDLYRSLQIKQINDADHNFSIGKCSDILFSKVVETVKQDSYPGKRKFCNN